MAKDNSVNESAVELFQPNNSFQPSPRPVTTVVPRPKITFTNPNLGQRKKIDLNLLKNFINTNEKIEIQCEITTPFSRHYISMLISKIRTIKVFLDNFTDKVPKKDKEELEKIKTYIYYLVKCINAFEINCGEEDKSSQFIQKYEDDIRRVYVNGMRGLSVKELGQPERGQQDLTGYLFDPKNEVYKNMKRENKENEKLTKKIDKILVSLGELEREREENNIEHIPFHETIAYFKSSADQYKSFKRLTETWDSQY